MKCSTNSRSLQHLWKIRPEEKLECFNQTMVESVSTTIFHQGSMPHAAKESPKTGESLQRGRVLMGMFLDSKIL